VAERSGTATRLTDAAEASPFWSAAWVDLLDNLAGARVLLVSASPDRARAALAGAGASVAVAEDPSEIRELAGWDVVALERVHSRLLGPAADRVAADGRVAFLVDNQLSPLRLLDWLAGRSTAGPGVAGPRALRTLLARAGLQPLQTFGLLRSSLAPVTAFDLAAPATTAAVLAAAAVRLRGLRLEALRLLLRLRSARAAAVPAWLVVAARPDARRSANRAQAITGRLGYDDSREPKVVRGEPPVALDKQYELLEHADAEAMALEVLAERGFPHAPRLLERPSPLLVRQSWVAGEPLHPDELAPAKLDGWLQKAGAILRTLHETTRRADGLVLVHGDFWLGNVLADGDRVVAVVDWTEAHWGGRRADADSLVESLVAAGLITPDRADAVRAFVAAEVDGE
jgi:hypothetical protein